jgi:radical SAM protein with 4Fe4S-binding SPASM domain
MVNNKENDLTVDQWKQGMDNLKKLDCQFAAFYGAEPMLEFNKLKYVVGYAESIGIHTTVITSGIRIPEFRKKVQKMVDMGAKSFSLSYDVLPYCASSKLKTEKAFQEMKWIRSLSGIRDVAAIATITSQNYHMIPVMIAKMSAEGIWTFFDFIHEDRGMPGTKCSGKCNIKIKPEDWEPLKQYLGLISHMKKGGYLVHTNDFFIDTVKELVKNNGDIYSWSCAEHKAFPSWVTIDCDGSVYPCDDFHTSRIYPKFHELENPITWREMFYEMEMDIRNNYCRCCWNTHIDAHAVKDGIVPITNYIHGDI